MARSCGLCRLAPREGEEMRPVRVFEGDDVEWVHGDVEPGLYQVCKECKDRMTPIVAERLGVPEEKLSANSYC